MSDQDVLAEWDRAEQDNAQNAETGMHMHSGPTSLEQKLDSELHPQRHALHKCIVFISIVTGGSAVLMGFGQVIGVFYVKQSAIELVLRLYVIVLCCLMIMNESEWSKYTRDSTLLRIWISRGIIYSFVGVLGLEENATAPARDNATNTMGNAYATLYFAVVAWFIILCGILYTLMGLCCLQLAHDRMRTSYEQRQVQAKHTERATFLVQSAMMDTTTPSSATTTGSTVI